MHHPLFFILIPSCMLFHGLITSDRKNAIATTITVAITLFNIAIYYLRCLYEANSTKRNTTSCSKDQAFRQFSLEEIRLSTDDFSSDSLIGSGGYGNVYKGTIHGSETTVAIKRLKEGSKQGEGEFWTEIKMLSKFQNEHLVSLIGFCNEGKERMLVYEYMSKGTLADHLHKFDRLEKNYDHPLSWEKRLEISIGAARGLHYLHTSKPKAIHRDVKTSNILLDESWVAKVSDFGLSKMGPGNKSFTHISTIVKGTFGYLDPEYFTTCRLTTKSDVYAFGVVLLEVLTGRPALDERIVEEGKNLAIWAIDYLKKGNVNDIVDNCLAGQVSQTCLKAFAEIAERCLGRKPHERPNMTDVLTKLESLLALQQKKNKNKKKKKKDRNSESKPGQGDLLHDLPIKPPKNRASATKYEVLRQFSITEILQATRSFNKSRIIGFGEDDEVLIGSLGGGKSNNVAIRRATSSVCYDRMDRELQFYHYNLPLPSHANNVVSLIGYCNTGDKYNIFVYDYMANGSLQDHLHKPYKNPLPWKQRLKICIDAARGLCCLHPTLKKSILHHVFNSTNIFLDENWVANVSDFGWSRRKQHSGWSRGVINSTDLDSGDITPTEKSYAYAFGLLLIEVLCANNESILQIEKDVEARAYWFKSKQRDDHSDNHSTYIDPELDGKISPDCLLMYVDTICNCLRDEFRERLSISEILTSLEGALKLQEASDGNMERALGTIRCLSEANSNMRNTRSCCTDPACRQFSLKEIQLSTSNFSPEFLIGSGALGKVYKGSIDGRAVAIKHLKEESREGEKEFWTEIKMLSEVQNEHLVSLIGFCNEGTERVLVYEYMPRGTVADHLHKIDRMGNGNPPLSWERRLKISIGAARGLHFLHTSQHKVIHGNIKSSNILLDESWVAKISGFGLSKMGPGNESFTNVSTEVIGTCGYLDPDVFMTGRLTTKSDVFAFGVVLLEVLTGRPAVDKRLVEEGHSLARWAIDYMRKGKVNDIVDSTLAGQVSQTCLEVFAEIAERCLDIQPHERPDMVDVHTNLELVLVLLQKEGVEDEVMSIESVCSDGVISLDELCEDPLAENMENPTTEATSYKGKGKGKDISKGKVKKDSPFKTNALIRWFQPKQSPKTKTSPTQPGIPKQSSKKKVSSMQLQGGFHRFSLQEIQQATDNFSQSNIIGLGEADKVYIGYLNDGENIVAIRRARTAYSTLCMAHELQSKLDNLPLPNHANVLSLIGYCNPDAEMILVYSYMANGSLQDHLHDPDKAPLPWKQRLKICIDAGHGLCYLQPILKQSILHREFNSTNILLDENWVAKVSDFGWSKNKGNSHVPRAVVGRWGFLDSDYVRDTTSTEKSYAYAFGLLLIEVLCSNNELILWDQDRESIASLFKSCTEGSLSRCIDPYLIGKISPDCLRMFVDTASSCLQDQGSKRPSLSEVVKSLKAALELQEAADGNNKGFYAL